MKTFWFLADCKLAILKFQEDPRNRFKMLATTLLLILFAATGLAQTLPEGYRAVYLVSNVDKTFAIAPKTPVKSGTTLVVYVPITNPQVPHLKHPNSTFADHPEAKKPPTKSTNNGTSKAATAPSNSPTQPSALMPAQRPTGKTWQPSLSSHAPRPRRRTLRPLM